MRRSSLKGNFPDIFKPAANDLTLLRISYILIKCVWGFFCLSFNIHTFKAQFLGGFSAQKEVQKPQMSAGAHGRKRWSRWVFRSRQKTVGRTSKCVPKQVMKRRSRGGAASAERKKGNHRSIPPHRQRRVSVLPPRASQPE